MRGLTELAKGNNKIEIKSEKTILQIIPAELLLYICVYLDFQTTFRMKEVSQDLNKQINHIFQQMIFWKHFPEMQITEDLCVSIGAKGYKHFATHITEKMLAPGYYSRKESFWHKEVSYVNSGNRWKLQKLQALIAKDDAVNILKKATRFQDVMPHIQDNNFDLRYIAHFMSVREVCVGEFGFIGLIPVLIHHNAYNSFSLFVKLYLGLHSCIKIKMPVQYSIGVLQNFIVGAGNKRYIDRYIELFIQYYPVNKQGCFFYQIESLCSQGQTEWVLHHLKAIPQSRRNAILLQYSKLNIQSELLDKICQEEQTIYAMHKSLKNALTFFENSVDLSDEDLIAHQNKINASFDRYLQTRNVPDSEMQFRF